MVFLLVLSTTSERKQNNRLYSLRLQHEGEVISVVGNSVFWQEIRAAALGPDTGHFVVEAQDSASAGLELVIVPLALQFLRRINGGVKGEGL